MRNNLGHPSRYVPSAGCQALSKELEKTQLTNLFLDFHAVCSRPYLRTLCITAQNTGSYVHAWVPLPREVLTSENWRY